MRILIIEDKYLHAEGMLQTLYAEGHRPLHVKQFEGILELRNLVRDFVPELLILDDRIAGTPLRGAQILSSVSDLVQDCTVILASVYANDPTIRDEYARASRFPVRSLAKPFNIAELLALIAETDN